VGEQVLPISSPLPDAAQFVAGQLLTSEFMQAPWSSAAAGSNGRVQTQL